MGKFVENLLNLFGFSRQSSSPAPARSDEMGSVKSSRGPQQPSDWEFDYWLRCAIRAQKPLDPNVGWCHFDNVLEDVKVMAQRSKRYALTSQDIADIWNGNLTEDAETAVLGSEKKVIRLKSGGWPLEIGARDKEVLVAIYACYFEGKATTTQNVASRLGRKNLTILHRLLCKVSFVRYREVDYTYYPVLSLLQEVWCWKSSYTSGYMTTLAAELMKHYAESGQLSSAAIEERLEEVAIALLRLRN